MSYFNEILKLVEFRTAHKKPVKYKQVSSLDNAKKKTFYVHDQTQPIEVVTVVNGENEVKNIAYRGDVVISGPKCEQYVVKLDKFFKLYNVVDEVAVPRPVPRQAAKVTPEIWKRVVPAGVKHVSFDAPWGEKMMLEKGDYIVKDGKGFYRNAYKIFEKAYNYPNM